MRKGDLGSTPLAMVLRSLADDRATGCLHVSRGEDEALVHLSAGLVYAVSVPGRRTQLGARLVSSGALSPEALASALDAQREDMAGWRLGELLVHLGYVDQDVVDGFVREQLHDAMWDLLHWQEGSWKFRAGEQTQQDLVPMTVEELLAAVQARTEGWTEIHSLVPGPNAVPVLAGQGASGQLALDTDAWSLLCQVNGERTVGQIAAESGQTLFETGQVLVGLVRAGIVAVAEPAAAPDLVVEPAPVVEVSAERSDNEETTYADSIARVSKALSDLLGPQPSATDPFEVPADLRTQPATPDLSNDPEWQRRQRIRAAAAAELAAAHAMAEAMRHGGSPAAVHAVTAEEAVADGGAEDGGVGAVGGVGTVGAEDVPPAEAVDPVSLVEDDRPMAQVVDLAARREAEEQARKEAAEREAEEQARREAEEAARREAEEQARREAEEQARREAEEQARREAEEAARRETEEQARREAEEAARLQAEREAEEQARREAEEQARREAEEQARREAEEQARREAEEQARREAEEQARREAEEAARLQAEREAEEAARREAEEAARREAEEAARREAEEAARREAEEAARREAEEAARLQAEREAEEQARREAEEQARREAEEAARREAEEAARREAEEAARLQAARLQAEREAEEAARREAEEQARREAEEQARREAEEQARREAEEAARLQAEREAEEQARREAEEQARREAEEAARREAEERASRRSDSSAVAAASAMLTELAAFGAEPPAAQVEEPPEEAEPEPAANGWDSDGWAVRVPAASGEDTQVAPAATRTATDATDTAALLRELSSLGDDDDPAPAPTPRVTTGTRRPITPEKGKKKRGFFSF